jgi:hypothetical protein
MRGVHMVNTVKKKPPEQVRERPSPRGGLAGIRAFQPEEESPLQISCRSGGLTYGCHMTDNHKSQNRQARIRILAAPSTSSTSRVRSKVTGFCHDCRRRRPGNQLRPLAFAAGVKPRKG